MNHARTTTLGSSVLERALKTASRSRMILLLPVLLANFLDARPSPAGGVTIITHGYNGDVNGWVTGMANKLPQYYRFPGTNFTTYTLSVTYSGGHYYLTTTRTQGGAPSATDSGELIVKLDWSQLAGGIFSTYSTYDVAAAVSWGLMQTNLITELGGHALTELPLHLIGHSRGGSLMSEISRLLGTNGLWVDHVTTLDPHPLNNDGFSDIPSGVDAPVHTYSNVLFHDNYWQDLGGGFFDPNGEPVLGAYVHQLVHLSGGYGNTSSVSPYHSNVHLWYHGSIDFATPASDTEASIGASERTNWWSAPEALGTQAGFYYSLIGGGDRLSTNQPLGAGFAAIRDGYNQWWDLGAGVSSNRWALTSNNGAWPNLIKFNRTATNSVAQGQNASVKLFYQWAQPAASQATVGIFLDDDLNPLNANDQLVGQFTLLGTGAATVSNVTVNVNLNATNAAVGYHALYAKISGGGRARFLYAPEIVQVTSSLLPPTLDIATGGPGQFLIGINGRAGQTLVLQSSTNLVSWQPLATNTLSTARWVYGDSQLMPDGQRFYRAALQ